MGQLLRAGLRRLRLSNSAALAAIRSSSVMTCQRVAARVPVRTSGLYVRYSRSCPAYADEQRRCRCEPSYRTRRWIGGKSRWSPVFKDRASAVSWDGHEAKAEKAWKKARLARVTLHEARTRDVGAGSVCDRRVNGSGSS